MYYREIDLGEFHGPIDETINHVHLLKSKGVEFVELSDEDIEMAVKDYPYFTISGYVPRSVYEAE
jgi:hypothetical protein